MLTTTDNASKVRVWDTHTGLQLLSLEGHTAPVFCARFGPHGRMLVSGSHDSTIRLWDLKYEKELAEMRRRAALEVELNEQLGEADLLNRKMMEAAAQAADECGAAPMATNQSEQEKLQIRMKLKQNQ